jgi:hypothetical protein
MTSCFASLGAVALGVPSPLAGEGQGEGYHATRPLDLAPNCSRNKHTPPVGLPLSPALPRKGGGSPLPLPRYPGKRHTSAERIA